MCGRLANTLPNDAMAQLFAAQPSNSLPEIPNFNVCPTNPVHVVRSGENGRHLIPMRWGFVPHWYQSVSAGPLLINARAETIANKPAFGEACRNRRCIIPATGFFEWTKDLQDRKLPWYFQRRDRAPIAFAGIWQSWGQEDPINTCAIVTTQANQNVSSIHHRMPVVLEQKDWPLWLGEAGKGAATLMRPGGEAVLEFHRVDPSVNSNRASGPELIEPFEAGDDRADPLI
ncbi:SOS response-associated peptidase [Parasedimentitalea huanghaiensis]|uniref:Abasic site processing protein n=1 Tax=Parasedimentitalea huanghaiensis TaxID=2682100 RepID=A0A6L6WJE2_9RHOB|nr:SOS response-associated peptidase [Zongyanglinia huanghaiensis]MVO17481.1 SOS response-associated peptidase [Zongyanglinia huanghaiensis]